jgi:hypothetical protein
MGGITHSNYINESKRNFDESLARLHVSITEPQARSREGSAKPLFDANYFISMHKFIILAPNVFFTTQDLIYLDPKEPPTGLHYRHLYKTRIPTCVSYELFIVNCVAFLFRVIQARSQDLPGGGRGRFLFMNIHMGFLCFKNNSILS